MHAWGMRALFDKPSFLIPPPATVVDRSFLDAAVRGDMLQALWWTAGVAADRPGDLDRARHAPGDR